MEGCPRPIEGNIENVLFVTGDLNTRINKEFYERFFT